MTLSTRRLARILLSCVALLVPAAAGAVNLVPNPSFESYTSCPASLSSLYLAAPWDAPTTGTSDFFNVCAGGPMPPVLCGVPLNAFGYQQPLTGSGYGGIIVRHSAAANYREYMQVPLTSPLVAGATYNVKFHVAFGNGCDVAIDRLGAYCSIGPVGPVPSFLPLPFTPQVQSAAGTFLTDTLNWVPISGNFVAVGGENHVTIGNFHDDATTATEAAGGPYPSCYYYIEDVSVSQVVQVDQACCLPGGQCVIATASECVLFGGTPQGVGVTCGMQPCGPVISTPVVVTGIPTSVLGTAQVQYDAVSRQHHVINLGSSGQDGVSIPAVDGARGLTLRWGDQDDFAAPGAAHAHIMSGITAGAVAGIVVARLNVVTNADNSETLTPDFSGVQAPSFWMELLDGAGAVVQRVLKSAGVPYHLKVFKSGTSAVMGGPQAQAVQRERAVRLSTRGLRTQSAEVRYTGQVIAQDGALSTPCAGVRFTREGGDDVTSLSGYAVKAAFPASNGPGAFSVAALETDPPCAGLDCPNGPGTGTSLRVLDNFIYLVGGESGASSVAVLAADPSSPSSLELTPAECCAGTRRGLAMVTSGAAAGDTGTPSLEWKLKALVAGTTSVVGHLGASFGSSACTVTPDFSSAGATGVRVVLRRGGVIVRELTNPQGGVMLPVSALTDGGAAVSAELPASSGGGAPAGLRIICITHPCPGWPVMMGGVVSIADQIDMEPVDPLPGGSITVPDDIASLELTSVNFPMLTSIGGSLRLSGTLDVPAAPTSMEFARPLLSPNPASGEVRVVFALPQAGRARVSVIDAAGRVVRGIAQGTFTAGAHSLSWDGRENSGAKAAPGVYFVRVESGLGSRVSRLTRLW